MLKYKVGDKLIEDTTGVMYIVIHTTYFNVGSYGKIGWWYTLRMVGKDTYKAHPCDWIDDVWYPLTKATRAIYA